MFGIEILGNWGKGIILMLKLFLSLRIFCLHKLLPLSSPGVVNKPFHCPGQFVDDVIFELIVLFSKVPIHTCHQKNSFVVVYVLEGSTSAGT